MNIKKRWVFLAVILIFSLGVRLIQWNKYAFAFYDEGVHAFFGLRSSYDLVVGTLYQPPVLFQLFGLVYSVFDKTIFFRLFNIFLSVTSIFLTYVWVKNNYSHKLALLSCFLLSINIIHFKYSRFLNQDSLLFCLGLSSLLLVDKFCSEENNLFLFLSGILLGFGIFTKFTFVLFNAVVILYLLYSKRVSLQKLKFFIIGEGAIVFIFLLPYILTYFKNSSSVYSITNYFSAYFGENMGDSLLSLSNIIMYAGESLNILGVGFLIFLYVLFSNKFDKKEYNFLILWVGFYFLILSLVSKSNPRYLFMQGLALIAFTVIISKFLLTRKEELFYVFLLLFISYSLFQFYNFFSTSNDFNSFQYVEYKPTVEAVDYINQRVSYNDYILTNEPYLFLSLHSVLPVSTEYPPHIRCPSSSIEYLVLVNSSKYGFNHFDESLLDENEEYYTLEVIINSTLNQFYIYKVESVSGCNKIAGPLKSGLYLSDIV